MFGGGNNPINDAGKAVEGGANDAINQINKTKDDAINQINQTKDQGINQLNQVKDEAGNTINQLKGEAENLANQALSEVKGELDQLKNTLLNELKNNWRGLIPGWLIFALAVTAFILVSIILAQIKAAISFWISIPKKIWQIISWLAKKLMKAKKI